MQNVAKLISLSELGYLISLGTIAVAKQNSYAGTLGGMLIAKQIPEKIIKYYGDKQIEHCELKYDKYGNYSHKCHSGNDSKLLNLVRRPDYAKNCNMINRGGDISIHKSGMPSGHSTVAGFMFATVLMESIQRYKDSKHIPVSLLLYTFIIAVLIPLARTDLECHTGVQVISGLILGFVLAIVLIGMEKAWILKYQRYKDDKEKFYDIFP